MNQGGCQGLRTGFQGSRAVAIHAGIGRSAGEKDIASRLDIGGVGAVRRSGEVNITVDQESEICELPVGREVDVAQRIYFVPVFAAR